MLRGQLRCPVTAKVQTFNINTRTPGLPEVVDAEEDGLTPDYPPGWGRLMIDVRIPNPFAGQINAQRAQAREGVEEQIRAQFAQVPAEQQSAQEIQAFRSAAWADIDAQLPAPPDTVAVRWTVADLHPTVMDAMVKGLTGMGIPLYPPTADALNGIAPEAAPPSPAPAALPAPAPPAAAASPAPAAAAPAAAAAAAQAGQPQAPAQPAPAAAQTPATGVQLAPPLQIAWGADDRAEGIVIGRVTRTYAIEGSAGAFRLVATTKGGSPRGALAAPPAVMTRDHARQWGEGQIRAGWIGEEQE